MDGRKIYCEIVEGVTFESRCLFSLSKVIEGNPVCENCILRELKKLKRCGIKDGKAKPTEEIKPQPKKRRKGKPERAKRKTSSDINVAKVTNLTKITEKYDVRSLSELLGKSMRRIQELAKEGKIPARKVGPHWVFDKAEIGRWLLNRKGDASEISQPSDQEETAIPQTPEDGESAGDPEENNKAKDPDGSEKSIAE